MVWLRERTADSNPLTVMVWRSAQQLQVGICLFSFSFLLLLFLLFLLLLLLLLRLSCMLLFRRHLSSAQSLVGLVLWFGCLGIIAAILSFHPYLEWRTVWLLYITLWKGAATINLLPICVGNSNWPVENFYHSDHNSGSVHLVWFVSLLMSLPSPWVVSRRFQSVFCSQTPPINFPRCQVISPTLLFYPRFPLILPTNIHCFLPKIS